MNTQSNRLTFLVIQSLDPYFEDTERSLHRHFPHAKIVRVLTEKDFRERLPELTHKHFDFVLADIHIPWAKVGEDEGEIPPQVQAEKNQTVHWRSGVRMVRMFSEAQKLAEQSITPHVYFTALNAKDLEQQEVPESEIITIGTGCLGYHIKSRLVADVPTN